MLSASSTSAEKYLPVEHETAVMTTAPQPHKRRRSAVACINCHDRKVRCNAAFHGFPCSNCLQDRVACELYGRKPSLDSPRRLIRPRLPEEGDEAPTTLITPSTQGLEVLSDEAAPDSRSQHRPTSVPYSTTTTQEQEPDPAVAAHERAEPATRLEAEKSTVVPFFAGESEGLEFIFDICAPNRALKGTHYIVNKQVHKREHIRNKTLQERVPLPELGLRQDLIRCFFHYVQPFLPLVDTYSFFHKYNQGIERVSHLLLWSMFFAAANFVNSETLKRHWFSSRKSFKEYCYQRARDIYDAQDEPDKIALIQAAILLALWYVDLEDRDGTSHWMGIAISLSHTIGLHRASSNLGQVPRTPFPASQLAIWKRIWWCCYYREAFASLGFGRPMRINIDDCDLPIPTAEEMLVDTLNLPASTMETYLPPDRERLASLWIHLLHLSMHVEHVLVTHYRPRRPLLSLSQLEIEDTDMWKLRDSAPLNTDHLPTTTLLHALHLQAYFNTVMIALYRPYVLKILQHLTSSERDHLRSVSRQRVKDAAANTTALINKLVSLDLIDLSSSMLVTAIMFAAQIHLFEIKQSEGLARQYASHHFNLHILVLAQLRRTYWTADHQHKLFTETLKVVESGEFNGTQDPRSVKSPSTINSTGVSGAEAGPPRHDQIYASQNDQSVECGGFSSTGQALEDFFLSFNPNPFINLPTDFDPGTPGEWVLGSGIPLNLESA